MSVDVNVDAPVDDREPVVVDVDEPTNEPTDGIPYGNDDLDGSVIEGVLTGVDFGGTEMACGFADDAVIGARVKCNSGWATAALKQIDGKKIRLVDYQCDATEYFEITEDGVVTEYVVSGCTGGLEHGKRYRATGEYEVLKDQWRHGKQVDIHQLVVSTIEEV